MTDASRAVGVAGSRFAGKRGPYLDQVNEEYVRMREQHEKGRERNPRISIAAARERKTPIDWKGYTPPTPGFTGVRALRNYDLATLARYIDWTPFFASWELTGRYPGILDDKIVSEPARARGQAMLKKIVDEKQLTAHGVVGFW
ncbi:MAG: vitamin B12 dependent-methionine synthase activation domain-containing protein [Parvularculaceae bacterium]